MAVANREADPSQRAVLDRVGALDIGIDEVTAIQGVLRDTGAVDVIEDDIERLTRSALEAIEVAAITDEARVALVDLAHFVAWRES